MAERFPVKELHDIVLVIGRVMTGDWATIIFRGRSQERSASFDIKAATMTASGKIWGRWSDHVSFPKRHGPTRPIPFDDDDEPPEEEFNQCIFIDTYQCFERPWYNRLKLIRLLVGSATSRSHTHGTRPNQASPPGALQGSSTQTQQSSMGSSRGCDEAVSIVHVQILNALVHGY